MTSEKPFFDWSTKAAQNFGRIGLAVSLLLVSLMVTVNYAPEEYRKISYDSNEERLQPVLRSSNPELRDLAQGLIAQESEIYKQSEYSEHYLVPVSRSLYKLHRDQPKLFAVNNEWLIAVAETNSLEQDDLLRLLELAASTAYLSTTHATDWLLSVFGARTLILDQSAGFSAIEERISSGKSSAPLEGSAKSR